MARVVVLVAALALAVPAAAGARETAAARSWEACFGVVTATGPRGATRAELFASGRRAASAPVRRGTARLRPRLRPGRHELRVRFLRQGRVVRRGRPFAAWLLPRTAAQAKRERTRDARLSAQLGRLGAVFNGYSGFWIHELATGRTAGWNADASFPAASTVKLGVLVAAIDRFGAGTDTRAWPDIRDIAVWSSTVASNRLLILLGGSEAAGARIAQDRLHRMGATASTFTGNYLVGTALATDAPRPIPFVTYRRTTAHDLGRILFELHAAALGNRLSLRRTGLTRHEARIVLGLLLSSDPRGDNLGLLRPALPNVPMAQKQGWTTYLRHTAALVYARSGPVIVVVLTYRPQLRVEEARELGVKTVRLLHWGVGDIRSAS